MCCGLMILAQFDVNSVGFLNCERCWLCLILLYDGEFA